MVRQAVSIAFWNRVTLFLFCFCFLLLCHCVTRSCQVNHFLIGLQIIRFYAYYSKRNDVSSQSTLSVLIVNRNNEQMLLMYFRFACSRDIFRCNQLCMERVLFGNTVDHFRRSWIYYSFSTGGRGHPVHKTQATTLMARRFGPSDGVVLECIHFHHFQSRTESFNL